MARSNRTGASKPVARQAPPRPSVPASTVPRPGATPAAAAPQHHHAPPPAPAPAAAAPPMMGGGGGGGGMLSGLMGTVAQGMAFGGGSAVANRAIDSVMGPRQVEHVHTGAAPQAAAPANQQGMNTCGNEYNAFQDCVKNAGGDITPCQFYMDALTACKKMSA